MARRGESRARGQNNLIMSEAEAPAGARPQQQPKREKQQQQGQKPKGGGGGGEGGGGKGQQGQRGDASAGGAGGGGGGEKRRQQGQQGQQGQQQGQGQQSQQHKGGSGGGGGGAHTHHHNQQQRPQLSLFDHLTKRVPPQNTHSVEGDSSLHPATIRLGLLYRSGAVREDDDRVAALVSLFCNVIADYKTPTNNTLSRDLDKHVRTQMAHLIECRQHCMGMGNLHKELRQVISRVPLDWSESFAKSELIDWLHGFFENRIFYARDSIGEKVAEHIVKDDDVLLTFGSSPLLRRVLLKIADKRRFRLIIVDSRPLNNGIATLGALSPRVSCVYTPLSGLTNVMREATRVVLPATALLSNGSMLGDAGCAMVAAVAKSQRVPVIVLCETYKCSEKVQLGSIVFNELGATSEIAALEEAPPAVSESGHGQGQQASKAGAPQGPQFVYSPKQNAGYKGSVEPAPSAQGSPLPPYQILNPRYDCTPIGNISVVATENGLVPPTSIPVIIRELRVESEGAGAGGE